METDQTSYQKWQNELKDWRKRTNRAAISSAAFMCLGLINVMFVIAGASSNTDLGFGICISAVLLSWSFYLVLSTIIIALDKPAPPTDS